MDARPHKKEVKAQRNEGINAHPKRRRGTKQREIEEKNKTRRNNMRPHLRQGNNEINYPAIVKKKIRKKQQSLTPLKGSPARRRMTTPRTNQHHQQATTSINTATIKTQRKKQPYTNNRNHQTKPTNIKQQIKPKPENAEKTMK